MSFTKGKFETRANKQTRAHVTSNTHTRPRNRHHRAQPMDDRRLSPCADLPRAPYMFHSIFYRKMLHEREKRVFMDHVYFQHFYRLFAPISRAFVRIIGSFLDKTRMMLFSSCRELCSTMEPSSKVTGLRVVL